MLLNDRHQKVLVFVWTHQEQSSWVPSRIQRSEFLRFGCKKIPQQKEFSEQRIANSKQFSCAQDATLH